MPLMGTLGSVGDPVCEPKGCVSVAKHIQTRSLPPISRLGFGAAEWDSFSTQADGPSVVSGGTCKGEGESWDLDLAELKSSEELEASKCSIPFVLENQLLTS